MMEKDILLNGEIESVLVSAEEIDKITDKIAAQIDKEYANYDGKVVVLGILKGSVVFMADLMKKLKTPVEIDFMKVSSYNGTVSGGRINIILDINRKVLTESAIIVVEDIIDSGRTLSYLTEYLKLNGAADVKTCTLLDKPSRREVDFVPDYVGREIPDEFVVGYGLDYNEKYRTLPYVGILSRKVYEN